MFDRDDPRTFLLVTGALLGVVVIVAPFVIPDGGSTAAFMGVVLVAALGQFIWAVIRFRAWRACQRAS
jgi:hypothetical protein